MHPCSIITLLLLINLNKYIFTKEMEITRFSTATSFSTKDRDHLPHLYLAQPMFSLRLLVSVTALSWRFPFLFAEVQARDNSEKQEASAVLFPSWSPAGKNKRAGLCLYFVQLQTVELNAMPLSVLGSACHQGPKSHHAASAIELALHPHTTTTASCPQPQVSLEDSTPQPGTAFGLQDASVSSSWKNKCLSLGPQPQSLYTPNVNTTSQGKEGTSQGIWSHRFWLRVVGTP